MIPGRGTAAANTPSGRDGSNAQDKFPDPKGMRNHWYFKSVRRLLAGMLLQACIAFVSTAICINNIKKAERRGLSRSSFEHPTHFLNNPAFNFTGCAKKTECFLLCRTHWRIMTGESNYKRTGPTCAIGTQSLLFEPNILKCLLFSAPVSGEPRRLCTLFLHRALRHNFSSLSFLDRGQTKCLNMSNFSFSIPPLVGSPSSLGIHHFVSDASGQVSRRRLRFASRHKKKKMLLLPEILFKIINKTHSLNCYLNSYKRELKLKSH